MVWSGYLTKMIKIPVDEILWSLLNKASQVTECPSALSALAPWVPEFFKCQSALSTWVPWVVEYRSAYRNSQSIYRVSKMNKVLDLCLSE